MRRFIPKMPIMPKVPQHFGKLPEGYTFDTPSQVFNKFNVIGLRVA